MNAEQRYFDLRKRADRDRLEAARDAGALSQLVEELRTRFGCEDSESETMLAELRAIEEKKARLFDKALDRFEQEYPDET